MTTHPQQTPAAFFSLLSLSAASRAPLPNMMAGGFPSHHCWQSRADSLPTIRAPPSVHRRHRSISQTLRR